MPKIRVRLMSDSVQSVLQVIVVFSYCVIKFDVFRSMCRKRMLLGKIHYIVLSYLPSMFLFFRYNGREWKITLSKRSFLRSNSCVIHICANMIELNSLEFKRIFDRWSTSRQKWFISTTYHRFCEQFNFHTRCSVVELIFPIPAIYFGMLFCVEQQAGLIFKI